MKYIHAIKGAAIAFVIFSLAARFIPSNGSVDDVQLVLTISTFLFAIISGFFISRLNARYDGIRELISKEDAIFASLYQISRFFGKKFQTKIGNIIDEYYIIAYDDELGVYKENKAQFLSIYTELEKVKIAKNSKADKIFSEVIVALIEAENIRNKSSVISREKVRVGQWVVMLILSGIIIFSIFFIKSSGVFSQITTVLLSTTLVLVMLLIRDLQNCRLNGELLLVESGQEVFEDMGKLRYYNHFFLEEGTCKVPAHVKKYRLGMHKAGEKHKIKIVENL
ncbi:hypothetical protein HY605_00940, partial [Candidatus Peregrinibacteria bacterium]|nr:hypothetical protein [Candidatus Peregrinibacteria bacterium]